VSRYGTALSPASIETRGQQSASAADLQARVENILAEIAALSPSHRIVAIDIAGASDGAQFAVLVESAPELLVEGGLIPGLTTARMFAAGDVQQLLRARSTVVVTSAVADFQLAGAGQGTVFMGMLVEGSLGGAPFSDQVDWWVDPVNGQNTRSGETAASAVQSVEEVTRRIGPNAELTAGTTIHLLGSAPDQNLKLEGATVGPGASFVVQAESSSWTPLATGTFTGVTSYVTTSTDQSVTDAALVGGFAPYVGQRLRITGGARAGAVAWIAAETAPGVAKTSRFATYNPLVDAFPTNVAPVIGDPYVIETLPKLKSVDLEITRLATASSPNRWGWMQDIDVSDTSATSAEIQIRVGHVISRFEFWACRLAPADLGATAGSGLVAEGNVYLYSSLLPASANVTGSGVIFQNSMVLGRPGGFGFFSLYNAVGYLTSMTIEGAQLFLADRTTYTYSSGLSIANSPLYGINLIGGARLIAATGTSNRIFGTGQTSDAVRLASGCLVTYPNTRVPTITGGGSNWNVAGVTGAWAAAPVTAQLATHNAGIVLQAP